MKKKKFSDKDFNFREIINKLLVIKNAEIGESSSGIKNKENYDSILCYCYVDEEAGISFEHLAGYFFEKDEILNNLKNDVIYKIRFGAVINDEFKVLNNNTTGILEIDNKIKNIDEWYDKNEDSKKLRKDEIFDPFRYIGFPDDVIIYLMKDGLNTEKLYVKLIRIEGGKVFGKLLNEPHQDFGVHIDDEIEIDIVKSNQGEIYLIHHCKKIIIK